MTCVTEPAEGLVASARDNGVERDTREALVAPTDSTLLPGVDAELRKINCPMLPAHLPMVLRIAQLRRRMRRAMVGQRVGFFASPSQNTVRVV